MSTALLLTAAACASDAYAPQVSAVSPSAGEPGTPIAITGRFPVRMVTDFADHSRSRIDTTYAARLGDVALEGVTFVSESRLAARVPAAAAPGTRDLVVTDPWGREVSLGDAFTVVAPEPTTIVWGPLADAQDVGRPFEVSLEAVDGRGRVAGGFSGTVALGVDAPARVACVSGCTDEGTSAAFSDGRWTGELVVFGPDGAEVSVHAQATFGSGESNAFVLAIARSRPTGRLRVVPAAALPSDPIRLEVSGVDDRQTEPASILVSFDARGTASGPPPWSPWNEVRTLDVSYDAPGVYLARAALLDGDGDVGFLDVPVHVVAPDDLCVVDTASLDDDGAASCAGPFGADGALSLTEAVRLAGASPVRRTIVLRGPLAIAGSGHAPLALQNDVDLVGSGEVVLADLPIDVSGMDVRVEGLELTGDADVTVAQGAGLTLSRVNLHDAPGVTVAGRLVVDEARVEACSAGNDACLRLVGDGASLSLTRSRLHDLSAGAVHLTRCSASALVARSNVFLRMPAAIVSQCDGAMEIVHDTFREVGTAVYYAWGRGHVLAENVMSGYEGEPVHCGSARFDRREGQLVDGSPGCLAGDPATVVADPLFLDPWNDDLGLAPESPGVDASPESGEDLNGSAPGTFFGAAPDRGGLESW